MSKRAERRHHSQRMKAKARRIHRQNNYFLRTWANEAVRYKEFEDAAATRADHLKNCSCSMCGNPRKWMKEQTHQEDLADIKWKEERGDTNDSGSAA